MIYGVTPDGFKIKRLEDILAEKRQKYKDKLGENFDVSDSTFAGHQISISAEREAKIWEMAQATYYSQYRATSQGASLDNVVALTGNSRDGSSNSKVASGVARGQNLTPVPVGTIISVQGNSLSKFITMSPGLIDIVDGATFKSGYITLQAIEDGPIQANAGTLNVIETPVVGMDSFTNELDAEIGKEIEEDPELKKRVDQQLQVAGSATIEAINSELNGKEYIEKAIVFQNKYSIPDLDGRPPHSLDIVVLGGDEEQVADDIFKVIGGGIETIGDITKNVIDSQGFAQEIKFSRPEEIDIWVEIDLTIDPSLFPSDGANQVAALVLAYGNLQTVGQKIIIFGTNGLGGCFDSVPGINDFEIRIGKTIYPISDDNVAIAPRETARFDSSRISVAVI